MTEFADEFRLGFTVLLNAMAFGCAARFAWRAVPHKDRAPHPTGVRGVQAACDAFLIYFVVQYVSVAIPGALGFLNAGSMAALAAVASAFLWFAAPVPSDCVARDVFASDRNRLHLGFIGCALFTATFVGSYVRVERSVPPVATDALVYHLPTAVHWLQTGRLNLYETWYWNPAATYSPATGMTFMAWLLAPMHNDVFARFVQTPALLWIFFLASRLCLMMGADLFLAGLIATATCLSRALFSESVIPKDDLFVTAFIAAAIIGSHPDNLVDRIGPLRLGMAVGMVLASKYTALIACPIFLFLIDGPPRARWGRWQYLICAAIIVALALPWYLRNLLLTGNPLYPVDVRVGGRTIFRGLFTTERDRQLRSVAGVRTMLAGTYHSLPATLVFALGIAWVLGCTRGLKQTVRDPVRRTCCLGSVAVLILFLVSSPHHEVRYIFPLIFLWFGTIALAIVLWLPVGPVRWVVAAALAGVAVFTSFDASLLRFVVQFAGASISAAGIGVAIQAARVRGFLPKNRLALLGAVGCLALATWAYVDWHAWLDSYRQDVYVYWGEHARALYPEESPLWKYVRSDEVPAGSTIAYAHTTLVYPLCGSDEDRKIVYAPVRRGLTDFLHLPRLGETVPGDDILAAMLKAMNADPDPVTWMGNLKSRRADFLLIVFHKLQPDVDEPEPQSEPPEYTFAQSDPIHFRPVFANRDGVIYRIKW